ncbi:MAG: protein-glutamate O-methyltransferase CheR [Myxococcota bacterium]
MSSAQFKTVAQLAYRVAGLSLSGNKRGIVSSRLKVRMRTLDCDSFEDYLQRVDKSHDELEALIDVLTTNETRFYREMRHFEFLRRSVWPYLKTPVRVWSAACSTGEEAFTTAIEISQNCTPDAARGARVLATDVAPSVLEVGKKGVYSRDRLVAVPDNLRDRYFQAEGSDKATFKARRRLRSMVSFAKLNLMEGWPMKGFFSVIFLRNVLIYFDEQTRNWLTTRLAQYLVKGGVLIISHTESLDRVPANMRILQPSIYQRTEVSERGRMPARPSPAETR